MCPITPPGSGYVPPPMPGNVPPDGNHTQIQPGAKFIDFGESKSLGGAAQKDINLDPPDGTGSASGAWKGLGSLNPQNVQTDIYAVMALFQKIAQEQRNTGRELRQAELQSQIGLLNSAAQEIREAAQDRFVGAVLQGAMQIAGGAMQIAGGVASLGTLASAGGAKTPAESPSSASWTKGQTPATPPPAGGPVIGANRGPAPPVETPVTPAGQGVRGMDLPTKAQAYAQLGSGGSGITGGIGGMVSAGMEMSAAGHDARKAELESAAKVHEQGVQQANDLMQQMMDVIRDVRDKLGAMEQSRVETTRGIARNI